MSRGGETDMLDSVDVVRVLGALVPVDVVGLPSRGDGRTPGIGTFSDLGVAG